MRRGVAWRFAGMLAVLIAAVSASAGCVQPRLPTPAPGQSISWLLRVGPQRGRQPQPTACASHIELPCMVTRGVGEQRIEATLEIFLPPSRNHTFTGEALVGFVGADIGPAGHALRIDQATTPGASYEAAVVGLVTFKPGTYPIRIRLEETGSDLTSARQHAIDVMVTVQ